MKLLTDIIDSNKWYKILVIGFIFYTAILNALW